MKDESGFSLLEVVISLAALTLISGFILQMFIASLYLNRRAYNLDSAANAAAQALETFSAENASGGEITQYFDSLWERVTVVQADTQAYTQNINLILPDTVKYVVTVNASQEGVHEYEVYASFDSGGGFTVSSGQSKAYRIDASVYEITENKGREMIVGFSARKYA